MRSSRLSQELRSQPNVIIINTKSESSTIFMAVSFFVRVCVCSLVWTFHPIRCHLPSPQPFLDCGWGGLRVIHKLAQFIIAFGWDEGVTGAVWLRLELVFAWLVVGRVCGQAMVFVCGLVLTDG